MCIPSFGYCIPQIVAPVAGACCGFVSKQFFCFYGIEPIRTELQEIISKVASSRFGKFVGSAVGWQFGMLLSVPVTVYFSELVAWTVNETVQAIIRIVSSFFCEPLRKKAVEPSFMREMTIRVISFVTYFFAKSYFCNYAMPLVKPLLEFGIKHGVQVSVIPMSVLAAPLAIIATPPVTFLLGDILGSIASECCYQSLHQLCHLVLDSEDQEEAPV